jgi:hypothetical protein
VRMEIYYAKVAPTLDPVARIDHAEKVFASMGATIKHGGSRAYYAQDPCLTGSTAGVTPVLKRNSSDLLSVSLVIL